MRRLLFVLICAMALDSRGVAQNEIVTTIAGNGKAGFAVDGGPAVSATLAFPSGLAVDAAGNLFVADAYNERIRKISITAARSRRSPAMAQPVSQETEARLFRPHSISAAVRLPARTESPWTAPAMFL